VFINEAGWKALDRQIMEFLDEGNALTPLLQPLACADPTHDIKQYFTEHKPVVSRTAHDQAAERLKKPRRMENGSLGNVWVDLLLGVKEDARQKIQRQRDKNQNSRTRTRTRHYNYK
jgi:hypothetical protein